MDPSKEREILLDYQYTRDKNLALQEKRIKEINEKYTDIASLSNDIRMMGLNISKMLFNSCSDEDIETMRYELNSMIKKKSDLFEYYGIPSDYLDLKYRCPICKDTGFLESGDQCKCLKQKILQDSYRMSNLDKILDDSNFDKFNFSVFSDQEFENYELSPRENMKNIMSDIDEYLYYFKENKTCGKDNLLFTGTPGLGKTYLCSCIAREILKEGHTVIYQTAFNLMDIIEKYRFKRADYSRSDQENYNNVYETDLLIIDDLGTEMVNSFTISELFNILNSRINSKKKTIISTNLDVGMLYQVYTDRITSRIIGNFKIFEFYGPDLRLT